MGAGVARRGVGVRAAGGARVRLPAPPARAAAPRAPRAAPAAAARLLVTITCSYRYVTRVTL